jgi:hypothetical protein
MPEYRGPDPVVEITGVTEVARDLAVVPNRHIDLVPNVGVIGGTVRSWLSRPDWVRVTRRRY